MIDMNERDFKDAFSILDIGLIAVKVQHMVETVKRARRIKNQESKPLIQQLDEVEGKIEMAFQDGSPQQWELSEFIMY